MEALADQIIPPDQDPGGAWAGVANFVDRQLTGHYKEQAKFYRAGLAALDQTAVKLHGKPFAELAGEQQTALLETLEKGKAPEELWKEIGSRDFFRMLTDHSMQAYYGDPRHGGNRDYVSWKMLGVSTPPVRGRDQYDFTSQAPPEKGGKS